MVEKKEGSVSCQNIRNVMRACSGVAPTWVSWWGRGPALVASDAQYYFDGSTDTDWPVHDPCGTLDVNHKKGVSDPSGKIYLR